MQRKFIILLLALSSTVMLWGQVHPNHEIWYGSNNYDTITITHPESFNADILYHNFDLDYMVIAFTSNLTNVGQMAFKQISTLQWMELPSTVKSIDMEAFYSCTNLTSCNMPDSLTTIGDKAFASCTSLQSVTFPSTLISIGQEAFANCYNIKSVYIPRSVKEIKKEAFYLCIKLDTIFFSSVVPPVFGENALSRGVLVVPHGSEDAYSAALGNTFTGSIIYDTYAWQYQEMYIQDILSAVEGVTDSLILAIVADAVEDIMSTSNAEQMEQIKLFYLNKINSILYLQEAVAGVMDADILNIATVAIVNIAAANTDAAIDDYYFPAILALQSPLKYYNSGKNDGQSVGYTEGYNAARAELPTDAADATGHVVTITKGDKTLKLVNPDAVKYSQQ